MTRLSFCITKSQVFSGHAGILILEYKNAFSLPRMHNHVFFSQNLERSPSKGLPSEMSEFATHRQELTLPSILVNGSLLSW